MTKRKVSKMLKSNIRYPDNHVVGSSVYIWRDDAGWIGPATIKRVVKHDVTVEHNGIDKTSSSNRVRYIRRDDPPTDSDEDNHDEGSTPTVDCTEESNTRLQSTPSAESAGSLPEIRSKSNVIPRSELRNMLNEADDFINQPSRTRSGKQISPPSLLVKEPRHYSDEELDEAIPLIPASDRMMPRRVSPHYFNHFDSEERLAAYNREYDSWVREEAFIRLNRDRVPDDANIIGSHTRYTRKADGTVKASIVPWGNMDEDRNYLRTDSPCMNLEIFRLVLSLAAEHSWQIAQMDVSTAFLQAEGFTRDIYVKPPKEANDIMGLWKLKAAAYGLVDSGRLWYRTSDHSLLTDGHLTRSRFEPTLYFKGVIDMLAFVLVAQVDNYIYAGPKEELQSFEGFLPRRFRIGALDRKDFAVMGCEILQTAEGSIVLTQRSRSDDLNEDSLNITAVGANRIPDRGATLREVHLFLSALVRMLFIGRMSHPVML